MDASLRTHGNSGKDLDQQGLLVDLLARQLNPKDL
jgi:hypothetical protein